MPKKRALIGRGRKRNDANSRGTPDARNGPRKKLPLDALLNQNVPDLLSGYTKEELNELQEKISELGSEILEVLEFDEVEEIIGVKIDNESLWFYVRWEDNDCSFVPAKILHKIAPTKVIKFYENRLQFASSPNTKKEDPTGVENLQLRIPNGGDIVDKLTSRMFAERQIEEQQREQQLLLLQQQQPPPQPQQPSRDGPPRIGTNIPSSSQGVPPLKKPKTEFPGNPNNGIPKAGQKNFRKMSCTGCGILLQYPENTKAIKCPACSTVMHAR